MRTIVDTILVSVDFTNRDTGVLIVGRKKLNQTFEIINAFQGEEALNLYKILTTVKDDKDD